MEEQWKLITCLKHQEELRLEYEASNLGRIRIAKIHRLLTPHKHNSGYDAFQYSWTDKNGERRFTLMLWHRVIAMTWLDNPDNLPIIDHIDHDIHNNSIDNLRWVSYKGNMDNARLKGRKPLYNSQKPIYKIDGNNHIYHKYANAQECSDLDNVALGQIGRFCNGSRQPRKGGITYTQDVHLAQRGLKVVEVEGHYQVVALEEKL